MSQKLTLTRYLEGRGPVKSLTRIEAEAFGVPYPLVSGWPARYGAVEITPGMLDDLAARVAIAGRSTAKKARRGLAGLGRAAPADQVLGLPPQPAASSLQVPAPERIVHGFVLRRPRRSCAPVGTSGVKKPA